MKSDELILHGAVEHPAFRREVVLVLDQDDGGLGRIDGHDDPPRSVAQIFPNHRDEFPGRSRSN
jgi:hypothetical protein